MKRSMFFLVAVFVLLFGNAAFATVIDLTTAYSHSPTIIGDFGSVTLTAGNFGGDAFTDIKFQVQIDSASGSQATLKSFYFNVDPSLTGFSSSNIFATSGTIRDINMYERAGPSGYFDTELVYKGKSKYIEFYVSMKDTALTIENFLGLTNIGDWTFAAHLQNTNLSRCFDSEWVGGKNTPVPEPGSFGLVFAGLVGLIAFKRRFVG